MPRACVIVLDAVGAGELPDAHEYGDEGSDTLGNLAKAVGGLDLPNLEQLGLGNVEDLDGCPPTDHAPAVAGRLFERSKGKDTTTGHWELMGIVTPVAMPTYPHGFPFEVIEELPFPLKQLRSALRTRGIGRLEIRKRGVAVEPDRLRRALRLSGGAEATLVLTRVRERPTALLCRIAGNSAPPPGLRAT